MDKPDLNDPTELQPIIDFLFWINVAKKLQAVGLVAKVPYVIGNQATVRRLVRRAAAQGVAPRKDKVTIRRVILQIPFYSGSEPPREQTLDAFVAMTHQYQRFKGR